MTSRVHVNRATQALAGVVLAMGFTVVTPGLPAHAADAAGSSLAATNVATYSQGVQDVRRCRTYFDFFDTRTNVTCRKAGSVIREAIEGSRWPKSSVKQVQGFRCVKSKRYGESLIDCKRGRLFVHYDSRE